MINLSNKEASRQRYNLIKEKLFSIIKEKMKDYDK